MSDIQSTQTLVQLEPLACAFSPGKTLRKIIFTIFPPPGHHFSKTVPPHTREGGRPENTPKVSCNQTHFGSLIPCQALYFVSWSRWRTHFHPRKYAQKYFPHFPQKYLFAKWLDSPLCVRSSSWQLTHPQGLRERPEYPNWCKHDRWSQPDRQENP